MTIESDLLAIQMLPQVDRMIDLVLVQGDIHTATKLLGAMDQGEMGVFIGALAYRAVTESPFPDHTVMWAPPTGIPEDDPALWAFRIVCAAGNRDNDGMAALVQVIMGNGYLYVGMVVRHILIIIREGIEHRAWGGA